MAVEFPDDFPFNRRPAAPEQQRREHPQQAPARATATPPQDQPEAQPMSQAQSHPQVQLQPDAQVRPPVPAFSATPAAPQAPAARQPAHPVQAPAVAVAAIPPAAVAMAESMAGVAAAPALARRSERRRSPRQTLVAKAVIRSESTQTTVATGFISNISMLGIGFHTRRGLTVGEKFQLRVEVGPLKWATRLRVVSCQPHESGTYDVGAEFVGSDLSARALREIAA